MSLMVPVRVSSALASALALEEVALDAAVDAAVEAAGAAVEAATEAAVEAEVDAVESADELPQPASTEAARTVDVASANNFFLIIFIISFSVKICIPYRITKIIIVLIL